MELSSERIPTREKLILTGLYLSKYDSSGLQQLGFETFREAYNVIGYALGSRTASIKNYRDEFDPLFPNQRKGWHKRQMRDYCRKVFEEYGDLDLESFASLVKSFVGFDANAWSGIQAGEDVEEGGSSFSRMITGLAAEQYFESVHPGVPEFNGYVIENTTRYGCGYDFRLRLGTEQNFLAVEVKGLKALTGSLSFTPRELEVATALRDRFFLFVVKNFRDKPVHEIFQDPMSGRLRFKKSERRVVQVSWLTSV